MPTFQEYLVSIKDGEAHRQTRLQLMGDIEKETGRRLIVYAADFKKVGPGAANTIEFDDKVGFSDLIEGLEGQPLDVLIHSPGGSAEAAEQLITILRANFDDIRFIVPDMAMSAATLMCLAGNSILMDERSFLGPIDPQIQIASPDGGVTRLPAQTVIDGFMNARQAIFEDERAFRVFVPLLDRFSPYIQVCQHAIGLSKELAAMWLETYMFAGELNARERAQSITDYLSDYSQHKSHGRPISIEDATRQGLRVVDLRTQPKLRELVRKLWSCIHLYFDRSQQSKIFENAHGVCWGRQLNVREITIPMPSLPQRPTVQPRPGQSADKKQAPTRRGKGRKRK